MAVLDIVEVFILNSDLLDDVAAFLLVNGSLFLDVLDGFVRISNVLQVASFPLIEFRDNGILSHYGNWLLWSRHLTQLL